MKNLSVDNFIINAGGDLYAAGKKITNTLIQVSLTRIIKMYH